ncbi:hypothetical protein L2E44_11995, partial [Salmonella enterica subsp. enterica serovar Weltevreden]|uniref:hypothetical protein n=1 Tax=Salmonella enterica TaxID=28901 RepID=UPI001F3AA72E
MHSWKKKLVVSQLALACTLAITSQANATTYDTWTYYDNPTTALDWMDLTLYIQTFLLSYDCDNFLRIYSRG